MKEAGNIRFEKIYEWVLVAAFTVILCARFYTSHSLFKEDEKAAEKNQ